jgi:outer membrane protein insertion porin family
MIRQPYIKFFFITLFCFFKSHFSQNSNQDFSNFNQTLINKIIIENAKSDSLIYEKYFSNLEGKLFSSENLESIIQNLLSDFENGGYPFATVKIQSVVFDSDTTKKSVDIFISIDKGELQKINKVVIEGNTKTNEKVIINELRIENDEIYSQEKIDGIPILLNRLNFFEPVEPTQYFVDNENKGILKINVKEKNTNSFDGIIGYVPAQSDKEKGYFTGFVNIVLRNLFGTGRSASIKWKQESSQTQELNLKYLEPWIFNYPFNITFDFYQRKQDTTYVKRTIGGNLEYLATENISASLLLESEFIIPSLNIGSSVNVQNSTSLNTGLQVKVDYRDDIYSPTKGVFFGSIYKFRQKKITSDENSDGANINYHNYELDLGGYHSFFKKQVLSLEIHAKEIIGDYFDVSDYFQFGGTNSVRGYRENTFLGNRIIWSNLEYRFLLSQRSYLFGFWDSGYYLRTNDLDNSISRLEKYINGYGLGISLETGLGIMKVSYAVPQGSSFFDGFIHFGLVNDF